MSLLESASGSAGSSGFLMPDWGASVAGAVIFIGEDADLLTYADDGR